MSRLNRMCTSAYVKASWAGNKLKERTQKVIEDDSGMEIIAVVLIIVIVIALAVLFREKIMAFFESIWAKITGDADEGEFTKPT